jgi:hypothetical protein
MITIHLYKARRTLQSKPVNDVTILLTEELPEITGRSGEPVSNALARAQSSIYQREAMELAALLLKTLPGGTFDQLLCEMLKIKASHLTVSFGETKE